jgi:hypothetical protein
MVEIDLNVGGYLEDAIKTIARRSGDDALPSIHTISLVMYGSKHERSLYIYTYR